MSRLHRRAGPGADRGKGASVAWWLMALAGAVSLWGAPAAADSVPYTVFPAHPSVDKENPSAEQPTETKVTLTVRDSTVKYVVNELARQAHLQPTYVDSPVLSRRISVHFVDVNVMEALAVALRGTGLEARMAADRETVVIRTRDSAAPGARAQVAAGVIVGRVTDSTTGAGLSGAQVRVEGLPKLSAVTGDSGRFTLRDMPAGDQVLRVRLFGYRPVTRTVTVVDGERTTVLIAMAPVPTVLSGVVTTATGVQRKIEVGNDITSLNVDSIMHVAPVSTVTDLLESRVPGLTVMHTSGEPGAPSRLRLRGIGSISGNNDPIVIVDGVRVYSSQSDPRNDNLAPTNSNASTPTTDRLGQPRNQFSAPSPIDQLDPNSIETIEVFKGPSASALYGSDAASGVVVITTKHGRSGPTHWALNIGQGVNWIPGSWATNYFRFGYNVSGQGPICNWYDYTCVVTDSIRTFQALNDPRYTVFSHGSDQSASLTISGGVPTLQYNLTTSGTGTLGNLKLPASEQQRYEAAYGPIPGWMVRPDRYTTWGVNGALTALPAPTIRVTLQSSLFNSAQQQSPLQGAIAQLEGVYISGGYVTTPPNLSGRQTLSPLAQTPLVNDYVERVTADATTTQNNLTLSWQPRVWLPITGSGGLQTMQRIDKSYVPYGITPAGPSGCMGIQACFSDTAGFYGLGHGTAHSQTLTVGTEIPLPGQHITLAVGGNYYSGTTSDFQASTNQLAPGVSTPTSFFSLCGVIQCGTATQGTSGGSTYGWYVEPRLNINSRFFMAPGFRLDGGSGGTHATGTGGTVGGLSAFPKLDFSYLAVDRQGERPLWGILTLLRPRVAFGLAGTQPMPQDRLRLFNVGGALPSPGGLGRIASGGGSCPTVTLNGTTLPGVCQSTLGNTQLQPERSRELEGGFDATLWQGRLALTVTQYNKTRKNAIISIPVAPSISGRQGSGFLMAENIGEVRNTGTEITVNATVLESRALSWNVGANLSNDNNLLTHLSRGQTPDTTLGVVPGYPLFGQWVRPIVSFADNHPRDGIIEPNEVVLGDARVFQGQTNPKYQMDLNTNVRLLNGRLGIYATFAYQNGMTQTNEAALTSTSFLMVGNNPATPLSYQAAVQAALCATTGSLNCTSSTNYGLIQTVNTFRFNEFSVNYELPRTLSAWLRVPRATVALQGKNLGLHTNYRGKDPSVNAFSTVSSVDEAADLGQVPEPRTWWLKLTLGN